jgi:hypothetical protein
MPLDADPIADHDTNSLFVLREMENREGPLAIAAWGMTGLEPHYVSHFATCPNADAHRGHSRTSGTSQTSSVSHSSRDTAGDTQPPQDPGWRPAGRKYRSSAR